MRTILVLLACLLLSACEDTGARNDNHGYGWHYDWRGASGLRVRFEPGAVRPQLDTTKINGDATATAYHLTEQMYLSAIACAGAARPVLAPLVILVGAPLSTTDHYGTTHYYRDTATIVIRALPKDPRNWSMVLLEHQTLHYLLGGNIQAHGSDHFSRCSSY